MGGGKRECRDWDSQGGGTGSNTNIEVYRKIPIISPGLIFVFFGALIFVGASFWWGLLLEGILRFKMGWACQ